MGDPGLLVEIDDAHVVTLMQEGGMVGLGDGDWGLLTAVWSGRGPHGKVLGRSRSSCDEGQWVGSLQYWRDERRCRPMCRRVCA